MKQLYVRINNIIKDNILIFILVVLCFLFSNRELKPIAKLKTVETTATFSNYAVARAGINAVATDALSATKKIAKNYSLNLLVENINDYYDNINNLLKKHGGYLENFNSYKDENGETLNLSIKIPAKNVDNFLKNLKGDAYVKSENFYTTDYTERYTDNENRLKNLYARRNRLRDMMSKEVKTLADIISIEKELNNVQLEIERLEKSNMKIDNEVEYSNINITLEPNIKEIKNVNWSFKSAFANAINSLIIACMTILHYFIVFVVFIPLILIFFILFILSKKIYNFIKNKCIKQ